MKQVIKHRDIRLLKMIRRTDPVIPRPRDSNLGVSKKWSNFVAREHPTAFLIFSNRNSKISSERRLPAHVSTTETWALAVSIY